MQEELQLEQEKKEPVMNKIHNVDCLEFMKTIPDDYFDLVLTDPPYGINRDGGESGKNWKQYEKKGWDTKIPEGEIFKEIFRISKHQIIWGGNYFTKYLPSSMGWIYWDKGQKLTMSDGELAFTSYQKALRSVKFNRVEITLDGGVHPTQKPLKLFNYCIRKAIKESDIKSVFDPFIGSGTTAITSKELGLDWCGCELEKDYVEIANKRLSQVQGSLF